MVQATADPWTLEDDGKYFHFSFYEPSAITAISARVLFYAVGSEVIEDVSRPGIMWETPYKQANYLHTMAATPDEPGRPIMYLHFDLQGFDPDSMTYGVIHAASWAGIQWVNNFQVPHEKVPKCQISVVDVATRRMLAEGYFDVTDDPENGVKSMSRASNGTQGGFAVA